MKFFAFIKPKSRAEKRWRATEVTSGIYMGICFTWSEESSRYESKPLTPEQISNINKHPPDAVIMECCAKLPPLLSSQ